MANQPKQGNQGKGGNQNGGNKDERGFAGMDDAQREQAESAGGSTNTPAQQQARQENIKKAQEARRKS